MAILYLVFYLIILGVITYFSSKKEGTQDYLNSGKGLTVVESTWTTFASLLTGYNFVVGVTFAYLYGFWYLMSFVGAGLAFVVLYFFYKKRLASLQKDNDLFSIGDYFGLKYGGLSKNLINVITCLGLILFLVLQITVNTGLFSSLLGIDKILALLLTTGVVCLYLWFGGFKVSVRTDIFQGLLMLPIILTIFFLPSNFSADKITLALDIDQFWFAIGLAFLQFFSLLGQAESFQRVFASKDAQSLKKGLTLSFILLALVAGSIAYLGVNFKLGGVVSDPSSLFTNGVLSVLPTWLASLLSISLIAAFMGTIDSSAFALGTLMAGFKRSTGNLLVKKARFFTLLGIIISALLSLYLFSLLSSVFALISLLSVVGASLLISFWFNPTKLELNTFLSIGLITFILGLIFKFITDSPLTSLTPSVLGFVAFLLMKVSKISLSQKAKLT